MTSSLKISKANVMITSKTLQINNFVLSKRDVVPNVLWQCVTCYI